MVSDAVMEPPGGPSLASTAIRFFADRFNRYRHAMRSKFNRLRRKDQRKRVRFRPKRELRQTHVLSPNSCFKRSREELGEMYRLQDVRRRDKRRAKSLMKNQRAKKTFFRSDYTRYIKEDEDVDDSDDAIMPITPRSNIYHRNIFHGHDDDDDDDDNAMVPVASNQNALLPY